MQFILTGFTPEIGFRVFAFQGIGADQTRTDFKVRADLSLIRKYDIRMQDLPLLCRGLLERRDENSQGRTLTFTEEDMRVHATGRAADKDAADKKKSMRRHAPVRVAPSSRFQSGNEEVHRVGAAGSDV